MSTVSMLKPVSRISLFSTGMALFSMFFGAGNLIFPLVIGQKAGSEFPAALWGLALSAVIFPFLGLMAMMFYGGDIYLFLKRFGKWPGLAILFCLQMSQGPVGAMPRLVTLMHASIKPYLPGVSLALFSALVCAGIYFLTVRKQKVIQLLGSILTPFLLLALGVLIGMAWFQPGQTVLAAEGPLHYFGEGLKMGYQTTDLLAALLFATLVMPHLAEGTEGLQKSVQRQIIQHRMKWASLIAAGLLMLTYVGLCWLSANHGTGLLSQIAPEDLLYVLAVNILGPIGGIVSAIAVFLACLTTAISLGTVFADYLKGFLGYKTALGCTLGITAVMANLGFSGIVKIWGPILEVLYPVLIALCVYNIIRRERATS